MISYRLEERVRKHTKHFQRDWDRDERCCVSTVGAAEMLKQLACRDMFGSQAMYLEIRSAQDRIRDRYSVADEVRAELALMQEGADRG